MTQTNRTLVMFGSQRRSYNRQAPGVIEFDGDTSDVMPIELLPGIGLVVKYDMAGTATFVLRYGDLKEKYTTVGGTQQLDNLPPELKAIPGPQHLTPLWIKDQIPPEGVRFCGLFTTTTAQHSP